MAGHARSVGAATEGSDRGRRASGFTLVEVLVVLAILATLIAMVAAGIPYALKQKEVTRARSLVNGVGATLEMLKNDTDAYGKYPPTRLRDLRIGKNLVGKELGQQNDINVGSECLYYLQNTDLVKIERPANTDLTLVDNLDEDRYKVARGTPDTEAREYVDPWGIPLVYFHCNDYKDHKGLTTLKNREGETIEVFPRKIPAKAGGGWLFPNGFQLFSLGLDGKQDDPDDPDEEGDDIVYGVQ